MSVPVRERGENRGRGKDPLLQQALEEQDEAHIGKTNSKTMTRKVRIMKTMTSCQARSPQFRVSLLSHLILKHLKPHLWFSLYVVENAVTQFEPFLRLEIYPGSPEKPAGTGFCSPGKSFPGKKYFHRGFFTRGKNCTGLIFPRWKKNHYPWNFFLPG